MKEQEIHPLLIISTGDSKKYRLNDNGANWDIVKALQKELKAYVEEKFPELGPKEYYSKLDVREIPASEAVTYLDIPDFKHDTPAEYKTYIHQEIEHYLDQKALSQNAPYADVQN